MDGFQTYQTFIALKNWFDHDYPYFLYNGKTNVKESTFVNRPDKWCFVKLARMYGVHIESLFLANFVYGEPEWVRDFMTAKADQNYKRWMKNQDAISHIFRDDCYCLYHLENPFISKDGQNPPLLVKVYQNEITIETLIILDLIIPFLNVWNNMITDPIIWPKFYNKCRKYKPWMEKLDIPKFKEIFKKVINEKDS